MGGSLSGRGGVILPLMHPDDGFEAERHHDHQVVLCDRVSTITQLDVALCRDPSTRLLDGKKQGSK